MEKTHMKRVQLLSELSLENLCRDFEERQIGFPSWNRCLVWSV